MVAMNPSFLQMVAKAGSTAHLNLVNAAQTRFPSGDQNFLMMRLQEQQFLRSTPKESASFTATLSVHRGLASAKTVAGDLPDLIQSFNQLDENSRLHVQIAAAYALTVFDQRSNRHWLPEYNLLGIPRTKADILRVLKKSNLTQLTDGLIKDGIVSIKTEEVGRISVNLISSDEARRHVDQGMSFVLSGALHLAVREFQEAADLYKSVGNAFGAAQLYLLSSRYLREMGDGEYAAVSEVAEELFRNLGYFAHGAHILFEDGVERGHSYDLYVASNFLENYLLGNGKILLPEPPLGLVLSLRKRAIEEESSNYDIREYFAETQLTMAQWLRRGRDDLLEANLLLSALHFLDYAVNRGPYDVEERRKEGLEKALEILEELKLI